MFEVQSDFNSIPKNNLFIYFLKKEKFSFFGSPTLLSPPSNIPPKYGQFNLSKSHHIRHENWKEL